MSMISMKGEPDPMPVRVRSIALQRLVRLASGPLLVSLGAGLASWADAPVPVRVAVVIGLASASGFLGGVGPAMFASLIGSAYLGYTMASPRGSWLYPSPVDVQVAIAVAAMILVSVPSGVLRRRADAFLVERSSRFKADARRRHTNRIFNDLDLIIWEAETNPWRMTRVSAGSEWVLGVKPGELSESPDAWIALVHPDDQEIVMSLHALTEGMTTRTAEYRMFDRDGRIVWISEKVWSSGPDSQHGRCINITDLKRAETRLAVIHAVARAVDEADTLHEAAPPILAAISKSLEWDLGLLWIVSDNQATVRCVETFGGADDWQRGFLATSLDRPMKRGEGLPGRVWQTGEPAWIVDVDNDDNFPRAAAANKAGLHSALAFPIHTEDEMLGVIEFFTHNVEQPDEDIIKLMESIGGQLGQFVKRREAERTVRESEALKSAMLQTALDCIVSIDSEGKVLDFNPAAEDVFGYTREEAIGRHLDELIIPPDLRERHRNSLAAYSSATDSRVIGRRIEMPAIRSDGSPLEVELSVTPVIGDGPPIFTGYLRDITAKKKEERDRAFLDEVGSLASSSLDHHASMTMVASKIVPYLADVCLIDVIDEERRVTRVAEVPGSTGDGPLFEFDRFLSEESDEHPLPRVLRTGVSELVEKIGPTSLEDISQDLADLARLQALGIRSFMVVPIVSGSVILGAFTLIGLNRPRVYGQDDLALAERMARRISRPLELSLLLRKRTKESRTLQQSLRPLKLPDIPGLEVGHEFRPATGGRSEMGGDFYDVFLYPQGQNRWGLVIGDVSGKGVQAAVLTALVRNTVFSEALQEREPRRILLNLNQAISEFVGRTLADQFCTLIYAKIDPMPNAARVNFVCAGHPSPILARADGSIELVGEPGSLLGVLQDVDLRETSVDLKAGDRFIMYTDGVTDARSNGDSFGEEGLLRILEGTTEMGAGATAAHIREEIERFVDGEHRDDVAVLVLRVHD